MADFQIVILDEADLLTNDAQSALRRIIEDNSAQTRFCIICNYVSKIIDPVVSRCAKFRFVSLDKESQLKHLKNIASKENMKICDDIIEKIQMVSQGDLRKSINLLQTLSKIDSVFLDGNLIDEICGIIPKNVIENFVDNCKGKDTKSLKNTVEEFLEDGYSIKGLLNQLGKFIMSDDCRLNEDKKFKVVEVICGEEKNLINLGTSRVVLLDLANKLAQIL